MISLRPPVYGGVRCNKPYFTALRSGYSQEVEAAVSPRPDPELRTRVTDPDQCVAPYHESRRSAAYLPAGISPAGLAYLRGFRDTGTSPAGSGGTDPKVLHRNMTHRSWRSATRRAARSPITTQGASVLPVVICGMIEASATRRF